MIQTVIETFLDEPHPVWDQTSTQVLADYKWKELKAQGFTPENYNTAGILFHHPETPFSKQALMDDPNKLQIIYLEDLNPLLKDFYEKHGLPGLGHETFPGQLTDKLQNAFSILSLGPNPMSSVKVLVRSIHVLYAQDPEIDISYSHPRLPFSIFVSLTTDDSWISNIRVAESILHEALHLKLSLVEAQTPLVYAHTGRVFYSPWRDEKRPAQGVLHGLFVFRGILDFYTGLIPSIKEPEALDFLAFRKYQIKEELTSLLTFRHCPDLTKAGAILTTNLLP